MLRDVFPNPFRPVQFTPSWLTADVRAVAETIYREYRFSDTPILGDALEEAGCTDPYILGHCRGDGPHVRGCHLIDAILGEA
jgi:hypothetical protein